MSDMRLKMSQLPETASLTDKDIFDVTKDFGHYLMSKKVTWKTIKTILNDYVSQNVKCNNAYVFALLYPLMEARLTETEKVWVKNNPTKQFKVDKWGRLQPAKLREVSPYTHKKAQLYNLGQG